MNLSSSRPILTLVALTGFLLVAGSEGCQSSIEPAPIPVCDPGSHVETVCPGDATPQASHDGAEPSNARISKSASPRSHTGPVDAVEEAPGACQDACVPDEACPYGLIAVGVCGVCDSDGDCPPPPPPSYACAPPPCSDSEHEELLCEGDPGFVEANGGQEQLSPGAGLCLIACITNPTCPSGSHGGLQCDEGQTSGGGDEPIHLGGCVPGCIPDDCVPGTAFVVTTEEGPAGTVVGSWACLPLPDPNDG